MNSAIIVAGGRSVRMGPDVDKAFLSLGSKPVLIHALMAFEKCRDVEEIILVVRKERVEAARCAVQMFGCTKVKKIVAGGPQRQVSVSNGLSHINEDVEIVVVHDGARPCVTPELISATIKSARNCGSGVAAVKITDTVKEVARGAIITKTIDRTKLWRVQTPQSFRRDLISDALEYVRKKRIRVTDE
ncbi:MAG: 2-C-methyl-D-erythritol 4-phosphate cytidylyltransferase, partial [Kiritimatiellia bacterium]